MSMKSYENFLKAQYNTEYIDSTQTESDVRILIKNMSGDIQKIGHTADVINKATCLPPLYRKVEIHIGFNLTASPTSLGVKK